MTKKISLIISTYNRPDALELVLLSVAKQVCVNELAYDDVEVLIADDGSTRETKELVQYYVDKLPFSLLHVWHEDLGFRLAAIRNLAISKSCGEYLIFIDGDCLIPPDFLINQYRLAENKKFVGGNRVLLSQKYTQQIIVNKDISIVNVSFCGAMIARLFGYTNKFSHFLRFNFKARWRNNNSQNWKRPKGCNMALWRDDLVAVNGFDEAFFGWGHEDADFLIRLIHAGVAIKDGRFAAPVYHLWHKMSDRSNEQKNIDLLNARIKDASIVKAKEGLNKY